MEEKLDHIPSVKKIVLTTDSLQSDSHHAGGKEKLKLSSGASWPVPASKEHKSSSSPSQFSTHNSESGPKSNNHLNVRNSNSLIDERRVSGTMLGSSDSVVVKKYMVHKKKNLANTLKELHVMKMNKLYVKDPKTGKMSVTVTDFSDIKESSNDREIIVMSDKGERRYIFTNEGDKLEFIALIKSRKHVRPEKGRHTSVSLVLKESELDPNTVLYPCEAWREGAVVKHKGKLLISRFRMALLESDPRSKSFSSKKSKHGMGVELVQAEDIDGTSCVKALGVPLLAVESFNWDRTTLVVHCKDLRILNFKMLVQQVREEVRTKILERVYPTINDISNMYTYRKWFETKKEICERSEEKGQHTNLKEMEVFKFKLNMEQKEELAKRMSDVSSVIYTSKKDMSDETKILKKEFYRVTRGMLKNKAKNGNRLFRVTDANLNYGLCSTYARYLIVPNEANDELLQKVSAYRSRGRIPIVTWVSPVNKGVNISRCAQPEVGISNKADDADETYVDMLRRCNKSCHCPQLVIVDCRPRVNANVNKLKGKGFEKIERYKECFFQFFDIHNIHKMRESLAAVKKLLCNPQDDGWYSRMDKTSWVIYMRCIISCATQVVNIITQKKSVMIHCSDGWDRTAQVSALSQVLLDNYYRSAEGFLVLVRKEWMWFGHMLSTRNGNFGNSGVPRTRRDQRSPVFVQWLECVYQIYRKFPGAFQFTEQFLLDIGKCWHSGEFGDFFFNCDKERRNATSTYAIPRSMQKWFMRCLAEPDNPYIKNDSDWERSSILNYQFAVKDLVLWERLYCAYDANDIQVGTLDLNFREPQISGLSSKGSFSKQLVTLPQPDLDFIRPATSSVRSNRVTGGEKNWSRDQLVKQVAALRGDLQIYQNEYGTLESLGLRGKSSKLWNSSNQSVDDAKSPESGVIFGEV